MKKGEITVKYSSGVGKWRDKREVLFISTEFSIIQYNKTVRNRQAGPNGPNAFILGK